MTELAPRDGTITFSLDDRLAKIGEPWLYLGFLVTASVGSPIFGNAVSWPFTILFATLSVAYMAFRFSESRGTVGAKLALTLQGIELSRHEKPVFQSSWSRIANIEHEAPSRLSLARCLTLKDAAGAVIGRIPVREDDARLAQLLALFRYYLPPAVEIIQRVSKMEGAPVAESFPDSLLPRIWALEAGQSVSKTKSFRYSPAAIQRISTLLKPRYGQNVLFALILIAMGCMFCFTVYSALMGPSGKYLKSGLISLAAIVFFVGLIAFERKVARQTKELAKGFHDEIILENRAIWVIREGRKIPARIQGGEWLSKAQGFDALRIPLIVAEETIWYGPSNMFDEDGLARLEALRANP